MMGTKRRDFITQLILALSDARTRTLELIADLSDEQMIGPRLAIVNPLLQMIDNTWEMTSSAFEPFPGFVAGPYKEYSEPWFADHKVLRGGCWATRSLLIRNNYRNFYKPDHRDVWAGFRTCSLSNER
jgi:EgtB-related family protein